MADDGLTKRESDTARGTSRRWGWIALLLLALGVVTTTRGGPKVRSQVRDREPVPLNAAMAHSGTGVREAGSRAGPGRRLAIPVGVDTVMRGALTLRVSATGQTEASHRATVIAGMAGRIQDLSVREGDRVGAGQVVARLEAREALLAVRRAGADLAEAAARYDEMTLFDDGIEDPTVRWRRARSARVKSGLDQAELNVREARLDLVATALLAPFSGRIADVVAGQGQTLAAGEALLTVVELDPILVVIRVVESDLRWLRQGGRAEVRLPALPDTVLQGRIRSIGPVVDPESRTARVTIVLANPDGGILPGMFAQASLEGRTFEDRVLVPGDAIVDRDGRTLVFVFEPIADGPAGGGTAKWVYVTTGVSSEGDVELLEGEGTEIVEPGTIVVTEGNQTLIHGTPLQIATDDLEEGRVP